MTRPSRFWLFYSTRSEMSLDRAVAVLGESGFTATAEPTGFAAQWYDGPVLHLAVGDRATALADAVRATDASIVEELTELDAVLAISFDDLDAALDDANTLIESEMQLMEASGGVVVLPWNGSVLRPE